MFRYVQRVCSKYVSIVVKQFSCCLGNLCVHSIYQLSLSMEWHSLHILWVKVILIGFHVSRTIIIRNIYYKTCLCLYSWATLRWYLLGNFTKRNRSWNKIINNPNYVWVVVTFYKARLSNSVYCYHITPPSPTITNIH